MTVVRVAAVVVAAACFSLACGAVEQEPSYLFLVAMDPTVEEPVDARMFASILNDLKVALVADVPVDFAVAAFVVERAMVNADARAEAQFPAAGTRDAIKKRNGNISRFAGEVSSLYQTAWETAQDTRTTPTSCLLSAIDALAERGREWNRNTRVALLLVTDLLESCDEWGVSVNFEDGPESLDVLGLEDLGLDFSGLDYVVTLRVPSKHYTTRRTVRLLEGFWRTAALAGGLDDSQWQVVQDLRAGWWRGSDDSQAPPVDE